MSVKGFFRPFPKGFSRHPGAWAASLFWIFQEPATRGQLCPEALVAPNQIEKTKRVAHGMDVAHLIGVNSRNRDWFDPVAFAAGDNEHFCVVIESVSPAKQLRNQLLVQHAKTALRVWNSLSAKVANPPAHITVHDAADEWHCARIIHAIADEKHGLCRGG